MKKLVIYLADLNGGGAERMHVNLAPEFIKQGYDLTFLVHEVRGSLKDAIPVGVKLVSLGCGRSISAVLPLARYLKAEKPDILVANLGHNNVVAVWAKLLARSKTKVIATQHSILSNETRRGRPLAYRALPWLYRLFLPYADGIVAVSRGAADDMASLCRLRRECITPIYNPVVNHDFDARLREHADHPWLMAGREVPVIIAMGRLTESKDFPTLLRATSEVLKQRRIRLILLGEGKLEGELRSLISQLGIAKHVDMQGFKLNPLPYVREADLLVMSSVYEGFGNALVEALACGTPVVSTDCPYGPAEILENGKYGPLVPVGDSFAMANAILKTLEKRPEKSMLIQRGREFGAAQAAMEYIKLFESMQSGKADVVMIGPFPADVRHIKGGVQASVYGLCAALHGHPGIGSVRGISTPVSVDSDNKELSGKLKNVFSGSLEGVEVTYLTAPLGFQVSSILHIPKVIGIIRAQKNPVVHIHGTGLLETALCLYMRLMRIPCVWTLHGIMEVETLHTLRSKGGGANFLRWIMYTVLERISKRLSRHIIVDTQYVRDAIHCKSAHVVPQGIFRNEFNGFTSYPKDNKLIACIGVITQRKGHIKTIEAFALLHKVVPDARLVIAGALMNDEYLHQMEARIRELGVGEYVTLAIQQPREAVLDILRRAQVFALHSREESQGIALCEALSCGLPVVATRVGGIPFVVHENEDGLLVEYGDVEGFAKALGRLLDDDMLRKKMAEVAISNSARYDWRNIAGDIVKIYQLARN